MQRTCYIQPDFKSKDLLRSFLNENIQICQKNLKCLNCRTVAISDVTGDINEQHGILAWDGLLLEFYRMVSNEYFNNYDIYYLEYAMEDAKNSKCDMIMVGSSYARFSIEDRIFENNGTRKNLSLSSQDLRETACKQRADMY